MVSPRAQFPWALLLLLVPGLSHPAKAKAPSDPPRQRHREGWLQQEDRASAAAGKFSKTKSLGSATGDVKAQVSVVRLSQAKPSVGTSHLRESSWNIMAFTLRSFRMEKVKVSGSLHGHNM